MVTRSRFRSLLLLATLCLSGCALVWDIQPADLDTRDAATDAHNHGDVMPAPGCQATGEACGDCRATSCCQPYNDCLADSTCHEALLAHDKCVEQTADGGSSTCAENFGLSGQLALSLVNCVFLSTCKEVCDGGKLGSACVEYCACMATWCSDAVFAEGSCMKNCVTLKANQLSCRSYHCQFAEQEPSVHCGHALGPPVCE